LQRLSSPTQRLQTLLTIVALQNHRKISFLPAFDQHFAQHLLPDVPKQLFLGTRVN
jgi:hypothetical protein